jgi:hypothetical protein
MGFSQLSLLSLRLVLLGSGLRLLPFRSTTRMSHHQLGSRLCRNVVVRQRASVSIACQQRSVFAVGRNAFLILDLGPYVFCSMGGFSPPGECCCLRVFMKVCVLVAVQPQMAYQEALLCLNLKNICCFSFLASSCFPP